MKVLIVSCVYPPEPVVSAQTSAQIAEELCNKGYQVVVVTGFPSRPGGTLYSGYHRKLFEDKEIHPALTIIRCFSIISRKSTVLSRLIENFSFGVTSGVRVLFMQKVDVIYSNSWPIIATAILVIIAIIKRIPIIVSVQDLYPEVLVTQNRFSPNNILIKVLKRIDQWIGEKADHIIVISQRFKEVYLNDRNIEENKVSLIPNWIDEYFIDFNVSTDDYRKSLGIDQDDFLCVYGGNVGSAAGLEEIIESFVYFIDSPKVKLLIAGEGSHLNKCQKLVTKLRLDNVFFHYPWKIEDTSVVLRSANLLLIPTANNQSFTSMPSKTLINMLAGRPLLVLAKSDSDIAEVVRNAKCGWIVEPGNMNDFINQIETIIKMDRKELEIMGELGRQFVIKNYGKERLLSAVIQLIEDFGLNGKANLG